MTIFRGLGKANLHEIDSVLTKTIILQLLKKAHAISIDDSSSIPSRLEVGGNFGAVVDITIYNAALSACVWLKYPLTAQEILLEMSRRGSKLNPVSYKIISKLTSSHNKIIYERSDGHDSSDSTAPQVMENSMLRDFQSMGALTEIEVLEIKKFYYTKSSNADGNTDEFKSRVSAHNSGQYAGCLGPDATEELRQCVIQHDLRKLSERPEGFSESDFATLIHQCRKRKWQNQVDTVLQFMIQRVSPSEEPGTTFSPSPSTPSTSHPWLSTESSYNLRRCIVPLTWTIFEACFDAYFCMDLADEAYALHSYLLLDEGVSNAAKTSLLLPESIWFIMKGFFRCGRADFAVSVYDSTCSNPTRQLLMGMMHGLGKGPSIFVALKILRTLIASSCSLVDRKLVSKRIVDCDSATELSQETPPYSLQTCRSFLVTLLESCAVLGNIEGMEHILGITQTYVRFEGAVADSSHDKGDVMEEVLIDLMRSNDCDYIAVCLMGCAASGDPTSAHAMLTSWQSPPLSYLPPYLFLHGLLAECFAQTVQSTSQISASSEMYSLPFKGFAKFGAVRHLERRRGFLRKTIPKCSQLSVGTDHIATIFDEFVQSSSSTAATQKVIRADSVNEGSVDGAVSSAIGFPLSVQYVIGGGSSEGENDSNEETDTVQHVRKASSKMDSSKGHKVSWPGEEDVLLTHYIVTSLSLPGYSVCRKPSTPLALNGALSPGVDNPIQSAALGGTLSSDTGVKSGRDVGSEMGSEESVVVSLLALQHLATRLLRVRDKEAKEELQRQVTLSFYMASVRARQVSEPQMTCSEGGKALSSQMLRYARILLKNFLLSVSALDINGKQSSRLITTLFEGMEQWQLVKSDIFDTSLLAELLLAEPCLDVLKELQRHCCILGTDHGSSTMGRILLALLEKDKEKLVKVMMFMQQQRLFDSVDVSRLEPLLVSALSNSPEGCWSAVMAYMTGVGDADSSRSHDKDNNSNNKEKNKNKEKDRSSNIQCIREACRRLVRGLLSPPDTQQHSGGVKTYVSEAVLGEGRTLDLSIARRLLCRYEISDDLEFQHLFTSVRDYTSGDGEAGSSNTSSSSAVAGGDSVEYLPPVYSRSDIIWVDGSDLTLLSLASDVLLPSSDPDDMLEIQESMRMVVGIDVEWRPFSTGMPPTPCSILQIGCRTHCFLFDLLALERCPSVVTLDTRSDVSHSNRQPLCHTQSSHEQSASSSSSTSSSSSSSSTSSSSSSSSSSPPLCSEEASTMFSSLLIQLFSDPSILKLGFGLLGDFKRLEHSYPTSEHFEYSSMQNVFDISTSPYCQGKGLSSVCSSLLGKPLNKRFQLTDWQKRPLSEDQIVYAASDAGVLIAVYTAMNPSNLLQ